ncbi:MAG: dipicolinate synthase subunit DpsA [Hyphomonadaceae bacterium]|nr:dipicolinate synthase subunit DpsA [Clostridia bacterium]
MGNIKSFCIIGGDLRQVKLANALSHDGYRVNVIGFSGIEFSDTVTLYDDLENAVTGVDVVIAPLPCSVDGNTVNTFFYHKKIIFSDLFKALSKNQIFLAGKIDEKIHNLAKVYNIYVIDYFDREEMTVLNAIPTAEGAVQIAMEEMPITLHNSDCLILGFGRIGKMLAKMLNGIGAHVSVEARKYEDLAWINGFGYKPIPLKEIIDHIGNYHCIFNTVPSMILDENMLKKIDKDCLVIDLASKPGGVDFEMASNLGLKTIWALSLPGKVAPETAGEIIKHTVLNIIEELGV